MGKSRFVAAYSSIVACCLRIMKHFFTRERGIGLHCRADIRTPPLSEQDCHRQCTSSVSICRSIRLIEKELVSCCKKIWSIAGRELLGFDAVEM